jgi:hypothetical protein
MNKRKILVCGTFIIATLIVGAAFVTAATYLQLAVATIIYLFLAIFFFNAFPRTARVGSRGSPIAAFPPMIGSIGKIGGPTKTENVGIIDIDKRAFLKLIGGAGLAFFIFSLFNRRIDGLFSKALPAPVTSQTIDNGDLAKHQPMDGYSISEIDDNIIAFYGFTNQEGGWFIMREDTDSGSFRYIRGNANFPVSWAGRANLKYDYYSKVFKL